jgi:hypothetical protein
VIARKFVERRLKSELFLYYKVKVMLYMADYICIKT